MISDTYYIFLQNSCHQQEVTVTLSFPIFSKAVYSIPLPVMSNEGPSLLGSCLWGLFSIRDKNRTKQNETPSETR